MRCDQHFAQCKNNMYLQILKIPVWKICSHQPRSLHLFCFGKAVNTNALSFYRSQNVLGWSKFCVAHQKFIYILRQSQTFCARQKDDLHSVKLVFCGHKSFWRGTKCSQIFGLAQKIWIGTKHFGTCKRTRH